MIRTLVTASTAWAGTRPRRTAPAVIWYPTRQGEFGEGPEDRPHGAMVCRRSTRAVTPMEARETHPLGSAGARDIELLLLPGSQGRPDVIDGRIGGTGFSVGGEMMLQAAASNTGLCPVVWEGAGVRLVREDLDRGPRGRAALPESVVKTAPAAILSGTSSATPRSFDLLPRISPRLLLPRLRGGGRGGGGEGATRVTTRPFFARKGLEN